MFQLRLLINWFLTLTVPAGENRILLYPHRQQKAKIVSVRSTPTRHLPGASSTTRSSSHEYERASNRRRPFCDGQASLRAGSRQMLHRQLNKRNSTLDRRNYRNLRGRHLLRLLLSQLPHPRHSNNTFRNEKKTAQPVLTAERIAELTQSSMEPTTRADPDKIRASSFLLCRRYKKDPFRARTLGPSAMVVRSSEMIWVRHRHKYMIPGAQKIRFFWKFL